MKTASRTVLRFWFGLMLIALLAVVLAGCSTINLTATTSKTVCAPWRGITYSGSRDTNATKRQIQVHNRTGKNLGCW